MSKKGNYRGGDRNSCSKCGKVFGCVNNLYRHYKRTHKVDYKQACFECYSCSKKCRSRESIKKHLRQHDSPLKKKPQLQCYVCKQVFRTYDYLEVHLTSSHEISFKILRRQFGSVQELKEWKSDYEGKSMCRFVSNGMPYTMKDGLKRRRLKCHRTGFFKSRGKGIKNLKLIGTNKINGTCPSTMQITQVAENNISVRVFEAHEGHDFSIQRLTLTPEQRADIAGQLSQGVSEIQILNSVKSWEVESGKTERLHLLTKKDINNIKRDFKLKNSLLVGENEDGVKTWVESFKNTDHDPVVVFKQHNQHLDGFPDESFILILMTRFQKEKFVESGDDIVCIYGLNLYSLHLLTISVVDPYGKGVPVCFCLSDKANVDLFKLVFESVRDTLKVFNPYILISDDDPLVYETWTSVMGPAHNHFLSPWSVWRNWSVFVKNKISGSCSSPKRKAILTTLKLLQSEVDPDKFDARLNEFVTSLEGDENIKTFLDYFVRIYANRVEEWAFCRLRTLSVDRNVYLEQLYKKLKCRYLDGKCKKLTVVVESLFVLVRDIYLEVTVQLLTYEGPGRTQLLRDSHYIALAKQTDPAVGICPQEENRYCVSSFVDPCLFYTVEKRSVEGCGCNRRCPLCELCVHEYTCTCTDNTVNLNICKHIHLVYQKNLNRNEANSLNVGSALEHGDYRDGAKTEDICRSVMLDSGLENRYSNDIATKCKLITDLSGKLDSNDERRDVVSNHLDLALKALNPLETPHNVSEQNNSLKTELGTEKRKIIIAEPLPQSLQNDYCDSNGYILNITTEYHQSYLELK